VTISKAIQVVREQLGMTQEEFAAVVGTTVTTTSRHETGKSSPSQKTLKKLASIAHEAGIEHLGNYFEAARHALITARAQKSISPRAERHIPFDDLQRWKVRGRDIQNALTSVLKEESILSERSREQIEACAHWGYELFNEISPYVSLIPTPAEINRRSGELWGPRKSDERN
jgi:putative transcriptional regulator